MIFFFKRSRQLLYWNLFQFCAVYIFMVIYTVLGIFSFTSSYLFFFFFYVLLYDIWQKRRKMQFLTLINLLSLFFWVLMFNGCGLNSIETLYWRTIWQPQRWPWTKRVNIDVTFELKSPAAVWKITDFYIMPILISRINM